MLTLRRSTRKIWLEQLALTVLPKDTAHYGSSDQLALGSPITRQARQRLCHGAGILTTLNNNFI
uniref:Uncharacterized protein n=1 Tax=Ciona intestinalis TaxID=7719 RepID=F6QF92_CIOIN